MNDKVWIEKIKAVYCEYTIDCKKDYITPTLNGFIRWIEGHYNKEKNEENQT